ncbi:O-antigen ligase family protein [Rhodoferax sp. TBRC 17660]|uniref:O-antigen ligase family protein n=1 Tax=Rhodoferax potami TaxID=3068338 RepID=A0ABU3KPK0_9BURK|nr:O-antigen ligase family protein [Rhodoferax sp. TBRC 17660]MDT7519676.1 O-antigen ligase family protein [Rhodoferax sp. TBRC 17660]
MILIIYSNINGLLGWEDFALKGFIKFQDYGLILALTLISFSVFRKEETLEPDYLKITKSRALLFAVNLHWFFYIGLFIFSILAMNNLTWPIKMGRTFFYGIIFYLIYKELKPNPIENFEKIITALQYFTIFFGICYISYNLLGLDIYPKGAYEEFEVASTAAPVARNFSGFPTFAYYFIFLFTQRLLTGSGKWFVNITGLSILLFCVPLMLTRGTLILVAVMLLALVVYRIPSSKTFVRLIVLTILIGVGLLIAPYVAEGHYQALMNRLQEFGTNGISGAKNLSVRSREFEQIVSNVIDFSPFIGFGFTVPAAFGFVTTQIHGGSADNGFSNLIGVSGFVGLAIFMSVIASWMILNIKLQALKAEQYSKVNFIFIFFMLGTFMNGSYMSYMHQFALFLAYDLFAFAYFKNKQVALPSVAPIIFTQTFPVK